MPRRGRALLDGRVGRLNFRRDGLRAVALLEAAKGLLVLLVGFGLVSLVHHDLGAIALEIVSRLHLNPASRYPEIFIYLADRLQDMRLWTFAGGAALYSALRFIEAYGLWLARRWAELFAALSGAIYIPIELLELAHRLTWIRASLLLVNAGVVVFMLYTLKHHERTL